MTTFYAHDPESGERHLYETEAEALEDIEIALEEYRKSSTFDGEWSSGVERLAVGIAGTDEDYEDDITLWRPTFVGNDEEGYDCTLVRVEPSPSSEPQAA